MVSTLAFDGIELDIIEFLAIAVSQDTFHDVTWFHGAHPGRRSGQ